MSFGLKIAATLSATAGVGIALVEAASAVGTVTGSPITDGAAGGAAIGGGLWLYLAKKMDTKADKADLEKAIERIDRNLERLTDHLMSDK